MCTCSRPRDVVSPKFPAFSRVNRHSPPSFLFSSFFAAQSRSFNSGEPRLSSDDLLNFQPLSPPPRRVVFLDLSRPPRKILLHPLTPFSNRDRVLDFLPVSIWECCVVVSENRGKVCSHSRFRRKWGNYVGVTKGLLTQRGSGDDVLLVEIFPMLFCFPSLRQKFYSLLLNTSANKIVY